MIGHHTSLFLWEEVIGMNNKMKQMERRMTKMSRNRNFRLYEFTFFVSSFACGLLYPSTYKGDNIFFVILYVIGIVILNLYVAIKLYGK